MKSRDNNLSASSSAIIEHCDRFAMFFLAKSRILPGVANLKINTHYDLFKKGKENTQKNILN